MSGNSNNHFLHQITSRIMEKTVSTTFRLTIRYTSRLSPLTFHAENNLLDVTFIYVWSLIYKKEKERTFLLCQINQTKNVNTRIANIRCIYICTKLQYNENAYGESL